MRAKIATAHFYGDHILVRTPALRDAVLQGGCLPLGRRWPPDGRDRKHIENLMRPWATGIKAWLFTGREFPG
jgi:hypothetical protein